jgi:hypothetical protein
MMTVRPSEAVNATLGWLRDVRGAACQCMARRSGLDEARSVLARPVGVWPLRRLGLCTAWFGPEWMGRGTASPNTAVLSLAERGMAGSGGASHVLGTPRRSRFGRPSSGEAMASLVEVWNGGHGLASPGASRSGHANGWARRIWEWPVWRSWGARTGCGLLRRWVFQGGPGDVRQCKECRVRVGWDRVRAGLAASCLAVEFRRCQARRLIESHGSFRRGGRGTA